MDKHEVSDVGQAFGRAIKLRRVEVGLTQEELADRAQLARSFVSGIERGTVKASTETVWKLSQGLTCRPSRIWLLAEALYFGEH
ncbi:helix-turn-helix domain-containing protein [Marinobacter sp. C2H3]|uniref:helix-turn-helix domain-containing protein n=1 Tax=Marinobacter sp. C2H3 TaxID=3119003 RepID=UPI00300F425D